MIENSSAKEDNIMSKEKIYGSFSRNFSRNENSDEKRVEKQRKLEDIRREEEKIKEKASGMYGINILEIEDLMGAYKERGSCLKDIDKIGDLGGTVGILNKLRTDPKTGISSEENRVNDFGSNKIFIEPVPPFCSYVKEALEDLMIRILIIAAVVQIILGSTVSEDPSKDWIDGMSIILAVLVVTLVGSITNYNKETKFHELNAIQNEGNLFRVIRNGVSFDIKSDDLLVGDLINIIVGDIFPADLLLVDGNGIKVDESSLTGESSVVSKEPYDICLSQIEYKKSSKVPSPCILSGTNCVEGTGYAVVIAVGSHSQKGINNSIINNKIRH